MLYPLKRLLICLDLSGMDDTLIRYSVMFAKAMNVEKLYFIHVVKSLEIPDALREEFPEMDTPLDESIINQIKPGIEKYTQGMDYDIGIKDGNATENIVKWAKIKNIDLIIMGRKKADLGSGANPTRIANISMCSVLMVPSGTPFTVDNIFIPTDFSSYSHRALLRALNIQDKQESGIIVQNVFRVPTGYHSTGKSYEEFAEIMRVNSRKDFDHFVKKYKLDNSKFDFMSTLDDDDQPADKICLEAEKLGSDLIMIGSRGRTTAASLLLGSIAVALLKYTYTIPIFIVKNKNENLGFFQALMNI